MLCNYVRLSADFANVAACKTQLERLQSCLMSLGNYDACHSYQTSKPTEFKNSKAGDEHEDKSETSNCRHEVETWKAAGTHNFSIDECVGLSRLHDGSPSVSAGQLVGTTTDLCHLVKSQVQALATGSSVDSPLSLSCHNSKSLQLTINSTENFMIDHVAIACHPGECDDIINWYINELQFKPLQIIAASGESTNSSDLLINLSSNSSQQSTSSDQAVMVERPNGMRMRAAIAGQTRIVVVEPLVGSGDNQVTQFLRDNHDKPGIQHVALRVKDIKETVRHMKRNGVKFIPIPVEYYDALSKRLPDAALELRDTDILFDIESSSHESSSYDGRCILQAFCAPLLPNGFFLELIERRADAEGFGADNILALWRAVEATIKHANIE